MLVVSCMSWNNSMSTKWLKTAVVEQAHEIQALARDLENYSKDAPRKLPDKFVAGGINSKLPPSWKDFATSLKHKRQEFAVVDLIDTLDVEEKARVKDKTHVKGLLGLLVPTWCKRRTTMHSKRRTSRIRTNQRLSRRLSSSRRSRQLGSATAVVDGTLCCKVSGSQG
jgi:hypothetical protein